MQCNEPLNLSHDAHTFPLKYHVYIVQPVILTLTNRYRMTVKFYKTAGFVVYYAM